MKNLKLIPCPVWCAHVGCLQNTTNPTWLCVQVASLHYDTWAAYPTLQAQNFVYVGCLSYPAAQYGVRIWVASRALQTQHDYVYRSPRYALWLVRYAGRQPYPTSQVWCAHVGCLQSTANPTWLCVRVTSLQAYTIRGSPTMPCTPGMLYTWATYPTL